MRFLFDLGPEEHGVVLDFPNWSSAEGFAEVHPGWEVLGEFTGYQPGPLWLMDIPRSIQ